MTDAAVCSVAARAEPLAGTAPHRPVWALVEHPGPWGRDAPLDAAWPDPDLGAALQAATDAAGIRLVLARRPGRAGQDAEPGRQVVLARTGVDGWTATLRTAAATDLPHLPWPELACATAPPGDATGPLWAVCTQGTRDACCARLGRPLAAAFEAAGEQVWEISHSGGHRFAGVVLTLPEGILYGRVEPPDVPALLAARGADAVVPQLMRGAVHRSPGAQAAEAALRERLGEPGRLGLALVEEADGTAGTVTTWRHAATGTAWRVRVQEHPLAPRPVSCGKPAEPGIAWHATDLTQVVRPA